MTILTEEQARVVEGVADRFGKRKCVTTVGGLAGTGKSVLAVNLPELLGLPGEAVRFATFTASVLNAKAGREIASTIHKLIYYTHWNHGPTCPAGKGSGPQVCNRIGCTSWVERRDRLDPEVKLIVIDEASMVGRSIYEDLISYRNPVVFVGDYGQLGPVAEDAWNLMDEENLDFRLTTIHRQVEDSPILELAMKARHDGFVKPGAYGEYADGGNELLLCWTNRSRLKFNRQERRDRGFDTKYPEAGDDVLCLKNNYRLGVYNGLKGQIKEIESRGKNYVATIRTAADFDYDGIVSGEQFGFERTLSINPNSKIALWDFGYCMTVHKSQGTEADNVWLYDEYTRGGADRWLYTAITRAKSGIVVERP